jgi:hypothetical protein
MRGCLSVLFIAVGLVLIAAWFAGPPLAGTLVEQSLDSAGFRAADRTATVTTDPPLEILTGRADRVTIRATRATLRDLAAERLVLTLSNVDLVARTFTRVDGQLDDVLIQSADGSSVRALDVALHGAPDAAMTTVRISEAVLRALLNEAVKRETGLSVTDVTLREPDRISFKAGLTITGRFVVESDGSLVIAAASPALRFTVFEPNPELTLTSVGVSGTDLVLTGTTDIQTLIR